ncbi:MAG: primosomal protein N' [Tissierellia bacterium]|nr:primosomal protein N' [Tissierellia bacterium]
MFANVIIDSNSVYFDQLYTYRIPKKLINSVKRGLRIIVPFGKKNKVALVVEILEEIDHEFEVKDILYLIDHEPIVSDELINLAFYMRQTYLSNLNLAIKQVLPPGKIELLNVLYRLKKQPENEFEKYLNTWRSFLDIKKEYDDKIENFENYHRNGLLEIIYNFNVNYKIKKEVYVKILNYDIEKLNRRAKKQIEILSYLNKRGITSLKKLLKDTNSSNSSVKSLEKKGFIKLYEKIVERKVLPDKVSDYKKKHLTEDQKKVFEKINDSKDETYLLKGVTGSGKTEIYLQLVEECLKENKESIILVPEISLTPQTIERFKGRFGDKIAILHSRLTLNERFQEYMKIKNKSVKIAIGARSAIFAPFENLGLIVIDEEHDQSYISSKDPKYNTFEIAEFRKKYHKANLLLASATPSFKSMQLALDGNIKLLELNKRVSNFKLPKTEIIDMRQELKSGNYSMLSRSLYENIKYNLDKKEQIILFLNKVGHTSFTFCRRCGYIIKCEACDVAMTYHKSKDKLICHYCGRTKNQPHICPNCSSKAIKEFGAGTEKLEEEIKSLFPKANVLRMDSETTTKKGSYQKMYDLMKSQKIDILIGTQMISKGLDFENVTLVGLVAADLSLGIDDYTSNEKTFQLITQVAGRAGRSIKRGRVLIQTYKPENKVIQCAKNNDYMSFFEYEKKLRETFIYPPFCDLINIRFTSKDKKEIFKCAYNIKNKLIDLKDQFSLVIQGPNPCKIERINNRYRYNLVVKTKKNNQILKVFKDIIDKERINSKISISIAINPSNLN